MQKLFLDLTLRSEQQEYLNEGIEWTVVEYFDNGIICDMIDERHKGMVPILYLRISDLFSNNNYKLKLTGGHIFIFLISKGSFHALMTSLLNKLMYIII